jgi:parallel beta-helix repeat protein
MLSLATLMVLSSLTILISIPRVASAYSPHGPIVISSNADFTPANGVTGGSGSWDSPYVIEGWEIDASTATGVSISNTDAHFIINNSYIHSGGTVFRGIEFSSVQNGAIDRSVISDNLEGVSISSSTKVNMTSNKVYGNAGNGVYITSSQNVRIASNQVYDNIGNGIYFYYCYPSTIIDTNTISVNAGNGIYLWRCMDFEITGNTVSGNDAHGVALKDTTNITVTSNTVDSNKETGIRLDQSDHAGIVNNTISLNGAGGVSLGGSSYANIDSNNISNGGISLGFNSDNSNITSNNISVGDYGIIVASSMNTYIASNSISQFTYYGIWLASSYGTLANDNSRITSNNITRNWDGIHVWGSRKVNITSNNVSYNSNCGIYVAPPLVDPASTEVGIISNTVSGNTKEGIYIGSSSTFIEARSNIVSGNLDGIYAGGSTASINIISNNVSNSAQVGIHLDSTTGASVYHNYIIGNAVQALDNKGLENSWDNGYPSGGNYWSDYTGVDWYNGPNQNIPGSDGIGDTPRIIDTNSSDRYPLMYLYGSPSSPTSLQAVRGDLHVNLTWLAPVSDGGHPITHYRIYRGMVSGGETFLIEIGNFLNYSDLGLTNGQTYYYIVSARNSVGEGPRSNEASATAAALPLPPIGLTAVPGNRIVTLNWSPPSYDGGLPVTGYRIYRGIVPGGETFLVAVGNVLTHADGGLTNGVTYYYEVAAVTGAGEGLKSNEVNATPATIPGRTRQLNAVGGDAQITLTWRAPANDGGSPITNYTIYSGTTSGGEAFRATVGNVLTYLDTGLTNGVTYYYTVAAVNVMGEGRASAEASATPYGVPSEPRSLSAVPGNQQITLTWNAPAKDGGYPIINYAIYRGLSSGAEALLTTIGNVTTYLDTPLTNGVTYFYKVAAVNTLGEGNLSAEASATPRTVPGPPTGVVAMSTYTSAIVEWQVPIDMGGSPVTNYSIYRGISPGGESLLVTVGNLLSYTDINVTNGQTYYYVVSAINIAGEGPKSLEVRVTIPNHPSAPLNLLAISGEREVSLTWDPPASDGGALITNYSIYRGFLSGGETYLTTIGVVTNFLDTGLTNGVAYYYRVTATNPVGEGPGSNEAMAVPSGLPSPPSIVSAVGIDSEIVLDISPPADTGGLQINTYKMYRGTSPDGEVFIADIGTPSTHFDAGLTNGIMYYYKLSAVNANGESNLSEEASAMPRALPSQPLNPQATAGFGQVQLTWRTPASDGGYPITAYKVYRGMTSGSETLLADLSTILSYADLAVTNGQRYYYKVSATTEVGEGPPSAEVAATPMTPPATPSPPQNLVALAGNGQVALTWIAPSSDGGSPVTGYSLYRSTVAGGEGFLGTVGNILSYTDAGLINGQTYYYEITASNLAGESGRSNEANAKPATVPGQPTGLVAVAGNLQATLTWNAPANDGGSSITNYVIYRGATSGSETVLATVGNVLTYLDADVNVGRAYYYSVSAVNAKGEGPQSGETSVTISQPPNVAPTCSITAPAQGADISGRVAIRGVAADTDGNIVVVEIRVDGGPWMGASGKNAWSYAWNTKLFSNGQHTIEARSYDGEDFSQVASVTVSVNNPADQGPSGAGGSSDAVGIALFIALLVLAVLLYLLFLKKKRPEETPAEHPEIPPKEEIPEKAAEEEWHGDYEAEADSLEESHQP